MAKADHLDSLRNLGPEIQPIRNEHSLETKEIRVVFGSRACRQQVSLTEKELELVVAALHDAGPDDRRLAKVVNATQQDIASTRAYVTSPEFTAPKPHIVS